MTAPAAIVLRPVGEPKPDRPAWPRPGPSRPFLIGSLMGGPGAFLALGSLALPLALGLMLQMMSPRGLREGLLARLRDSGQGSLVLLMLGLIVAGSVLVGILAGPVAEPRRSPSAWSWSGLPGTWSSGLRKIGPGGDGPGPGGARGRGGARRRLGRGDLGPAGPAPARLGRRPGDLGRVAADPPRLPGRRHRAGDASRRSTRITRRRDAAPNTAMSSLLQWAVESGAVGLGLLATAGLWCLVRLPGAIRRVGTADRALAFGLLGLAGLLRPVLGDPLDRRAGRRRPGRRRPWPGPPTAGWPAAPTCSSTAAESTHRDPHHEALPCEQPGSPGPDPVASQARRSRPRCRKPRSCTSRVATTRRPGCSSCPSARSGSAGGRSARSGWRARLGDVQCMLRRRGTTWHFQPVGPPGQVWIDGRPADQQRPLPLGVPFRVGDHWLTLRSAERRDRRLGLLRRPDHRRAPSRRGRARPPRPSPSRRPAEPRAAPARRPGRRRRAAPPLAGPARPARAVAQGPPGRAALGGPLEGGRRVDPGPVRRPPVADPRPRPDADPAAARRRGRPGRPARPARSSRGPPPSAPKDRRARPPARRRRGSRSGRRPARPDAAAAGARRRAGPSPPRRPPGPWSPCPPPPVDRSPRPARADRGPAEPTSPVAEAPGRRSPPSRSTVDPLPRPPPPDVEVRSPTPTEIVEARSPSRGRRASRSRAGRPRAAESTGDSVEVEPEPSLEDLDGARRPRSSRSSRILGRIGSASTARRPDAGRVPTEPVEPEPDRRDAAPVDRAAGRAGPGSRRPSGPSARSIFAAQGVRADRPRAGRRRPTRRRGRPSPRRPSPGPGLLDDARLARLVPGRRGRPGRWASAGSPWPIEWTLDGDGRQPRDAGWPSGPRGPPAPPIDPASLPRGGWWRSTAPHLAAWAVALARAADGEDHSEEVRVAARGRPARLAARGHDPVRRRADPGRPSRGGRRPRRTSAGPATSSR